VIRAARLGSIVLLLLTLVGCDGPAPPPPPPPPPPEIVPQLITKHVSEARAAVKNIDAEFPVAFAVERDWSSRPEGEVLTQDPLPGTILSEEETTVSVVVSKGYPEVPFVSVRSLRAAKRLLWRRGFEVEVKWLAKPPEPFFIAPYTEPQAVGTRPDAYREAPPGSVVTLLAWRPPKPLACDPSYLNVCIAPPPPYLNCDDVPFNNIAVVGADLHGFDGNDDDGVGCET
jgi:hypothetical protein